jgi:branched-subunit amino acid transport protein
VSDSTVWGVVVGMAVLNFAVRFVPIAVVSRIELPKPVMRWLSFVPISVMGALVAGTVVSPGGEFQAPWTNPWLLATAVTAFAYLRFRSFLGATVIGIIAFVAFRAVLGG